MSRAANNKGADQPAHPRSLISAFVVRCKCKNFRTLASCCGRTGRFVPGLVGNSQRHVLSCHGSCILNNGCKIVKKKKKKNTHILLASYLLRYPSNRRDRVAERLALPTLDHGVSGSNPAEFEIHSEPQRRFNSQVPSCPPFHLPDMTGILSKVRKTPIHSSIHPFLPPSLNPSIFQNWQSVVILCCPADERWLPVAAKVVIIIPFRKD